MDMTTPFDRSMQSYRKRQSLIPLTVLRRIEVEAEQRIGDRRRRRRRRRHAAAARAVVAVRPAVHTDAGQRTLRLVAHLQHLLLLLLLHLLVASADDGPQLLAHVVGRHVRTAVHRRSAGARRIIVACGVEKVFGNVLIRTRVCTIRTF